VAEVEQDTPTAGQDDLRGVAVSDCLEDDLLFVCHD
jgi:hypothetical protein